MASKIYFCRILVLSWSFVLAPQAMALSLEDRMVINESYTLEAQSQFAGAIDKMVSLLKANPNDYFVNYRLGWLFSLQKKYRNSADHYLKAARISPTSLEPWLGLSNVYISLGEYSEAIEASKEVLKRNPKNYFGMLRLNLALLKTKDYDSALENVNSAVKLYPSDAVFLEQKAVILKEMGRNDEAREAVSNLILVNPQNEFARIFLNK